ncbi:MAG: hypothetical protein Q8K68_11440, partial [Nitrospirota bacterium]|nr:hypothetical protein [Nitrospirota bacterium]
MNKVIDLMSSSCCSPSSEDNGSLLTLQPAMKEHGGNIYRASEETGIPVDKIIDFSASINPLGVPESVVQVIRENIKYLPHYPDPFAEQLSMQL